MSKVFHRNLNQPFRVAAKGDGVYLVDRDGRRYLDASGGAAVSCLGHSDPDVQRAVVEQVTSMAYAHTGFFTSDVMEELANRMVATTPSDWGMDKIYFVSGGSEAVEAAIKMARQYFVERGETTRRHVIARRRSYHGNTLGALAVGASQWRREPFDSMLNQVTHISPCYAYRWRWPEETVEAYGLRIADELETAILELGRQNVCAFIAETVSGASLGAVPPVPGYFKRVREICDRHGILLILDEVMCGFGRTGTLHACEQEGIAPDLMTVAKGMGGGYQPIGAVFVSAKVANAFAAGSGVFRNGHTYMGHAVACAAALAVLRAIDERDLLANVRSKGDLLDARLRERFADHPNVGDIRGRGLFRAIELVDDRASRAPFDHRFGVSGKIKLAAMDAGLICYPGSGSVDGHLGDHVLLAPPYIFEASHVDELIDKLSVAVDRVMETVRSKPMGHQGQNARASR